MNKIKEIIELLLKRENQTITFYPGLIITAEVRTDDDNFIDFTKETLCLEALKAEKNNVGHYILEGVKGNHRYNLTYIEDENADFIIDFIKKN